MKEVISVISDLGLQILTINLTITH